MKTIWKNVKTIQAILIVLLLASPVLSSISASGGAGPGNRSTSTTPVTSTTPETSTTPVTSITPALLASSQSVNVVIIGGSTLDWGDPCLGYGSDANDMGWTYGGCLQLTGIPAGFSFTPMLPSAVSTASLASYDTAVLNIASSAMACSSSSLTAQAKADLIAFVASGHKLIIFDSECGTAVDYSWLPFPFTTANPGAAGASGTVTIVEENTLSTNAAGPYYIDAALLGSATDAVGDMNVMTSNDPHWCVDMSGTNTQQVTGPVHTYAKYPAGTDTGLIIYNGFDQDYQFMYGYPGRADLIEIWVQELQQPFNPSNLPCGVTVVGISLTPASATNNVGTSHTVTATLKDLLNNPQSEVLVSFEVLTGPNAGASDSDTTDNAGVATFTYSDTGGAGTDEIQACFNNQAGQPVCSQIVLKTWETATTTTTTTTTSTTTTTPVGVPEFSSTAVAIALGSVGMIMAMGLAGRKFSKQI